MTVVASDDSRLRAVETDIALHGQRLEDHGKVIEAIETHLGSLSAQFQDHRAAVAAGFSKLEVRALVAALIFFASSSNGERIARIVGL